MAERRGKEDNHTPPSPHRHLHHHHGAPGHSYRFRQASSEMHQESSKGESPKPVSPISEDESPPLFMTSSAQIVPPHSSDVAESHDDAGTEKKTSRFSDDDVADSNNDASGEEKTTPFPADSGDDVAGTSDNGDDGGPSDDSEGQRRLRSFRKAYSSHSSSASSELSRKSTDSCTCGFLEFFQNALSLEDFPGPQPEELQNIGDDWNSDPAVPSTSSSSSCVLQRRTKPSTDDADADDLGLEEKESTEEVRSMEEGGARNSAGGGGDGENKEDEAGEGCSSDSENEDLRASSPITDGWHVLPEILLEDIFGMLTPKQRHQASMVCRPWYEIFYSPRVWETFVLFERTLTKRRFNLYKGYQRELCPRKTQMCLMRVGCYFKRIIVTPINDYYNLYEFLRVLEAFLAFHPTYPMPLLSTFRFTFACESRGVNGKAIIGTGGNILSKLKDLIINMKDLHHLALNELLLEPEEVEGLLAAASRGSQDSLRYLEIINCSKVPVSICEVTQFSQLQDLKLSPQHLCEELVLLLGGSPTLQRLHIVQDAYTCSSAPVAHEAWKLFREMGASKRVFLEVEGTSSDPLLLQPHAPVRGVIFRTPYHRLTPELATWVLEWYSSTLEYFVQERLPRRHGSRRFSERADESVMRLVRLCPRLHTLVIRERISLATMLLVAREAKGLRCLTLRRNALLKRCEWPKAQGWTDEFHAWLRKHGRDYDLAFQQMPQLLKRPWKPCLDKGFKSYRVHLT